MTVPRHGTWRNPVKHLAAHQGAERVVFRRGDTVPPAERVLGTAVPGLGTAQCGIVSNITACYRRREPNGRRRRRRRDERVDEKPKRSGARTKFKNARARGRKTIALGAHSRRRRRTFGASRPISVRTLPSSPPPPVNAITNAVYTGANAFGP